MDYGMYNGQKQDYGVTQHMVQQILDSQRLNREYRERKTRQREMLPSRI